MRPPTKTRSQHIPNRLNHYRRDLRQMESQYKKGRPQSAILMAYGAEVINGESRPLNMLMDPSDDINIMDTAVLLAGLESAGSLTDAETLRDLFWTVYAKLHAVIEGHRVVFEVVNRISSVSWRPQSSNACY